MDVRRDLSNGVNGPTGEYLLPPLAPADVAAERAGPPRRGSRRRQPAEAGARGAHRAHLPAAVRRRSRGRRRGGLDGRLQRGRGHGARRGRRPGRAPPRRSATRRSRARPQPGERWAEWLDRHGTAPGNVDPEKIPYYVLLVGSPAEIPFDFQYLLGVEYAVGRLSFDGLVATSATCCGLREYEQSAPARDSAATFFGTPPARRRHAAVGGVARDALAASFRPEGRFRRSVPGHRVDHVVGEPATKDALGEILAGTGPSGRPRALILGHARTGRLASRAPRPGLPPRRCSARTGQARRAGSRRSTTSRPTTSRPRPACTGSSPSSSRASPPALERGRVRPCPGSRRQQLATEPFVAALPKALLSHPANGRSPSWGTSTEPGATRSSGEDARLLPFQNAIGRICSASPSRTHSRTSTSRYAALLPTSLSDLLERIGFGGLVVPDAELARLWTERNDAQNVVLGDPAAAARVD